MSRHMPLKCRPDYMQMTMNPHSQTINPLYLIQNFLLELPLNLLSLFIGVRLAVEVEECAEVELG